MYNSVNRVVVKVSKYILYTLNKKRLDFGLCWKGVTSIEDIQRGNQLI